MVFSKIVVKIVDLEFPFCGGFRSPAGTFLAPQKEILFQRISGSNNIACGNIIRLRGYYYWAQAPVIMLQIYLLAANIIAAGILLACGQYLLPQGKLTCSRFRAILLVAKLPVLLQLNLAAGAVLQLQPKDLALHYWGQSPQ